MEINEITKIKEDERGTIFECGQVNFIRRNAGSISADHAHPEPERVYLVRGKIELTIGDETKTVEAPIYFDTKPNQYHKLVALTEIELIYNRS